MSSGTAFVSVITVASNFVNEMLAAAAASVTMPSFSLPNIVPVGSQEIGLSGSLALAAPTAAFEANPLNQVDVTCSCSGTVRLTDGGSSLVEVEATLTATVSVALIVDVSPTSLAIRLDLSGASASAVDVSVEFGPPLVPVYESAITSPAVLEALSDALRAIPAQALTFTIPGAQGTIDISYSGISVSLPVSQIVVVPLDGVLDIAAAVSGYTNGDDSDLPNLIAEPSGVFTVGSFNALGVFETYETGQVPANSATLAAAMDANFVISVVNGPLSAQIAGKTFDGVEVDSISLSQSYLQPVLSESSLPTLLWFDCLTLNLSGRYIGQSFTFSASYTPVLLEAIPTPSWQFDLVAWSLSAPALAPIKAVANTLFPFAPLIATSAINAGVDSLVQNAISPYSSFGFGNFATTGAQPLPGGSGWSVSYGLLGLSVDGPELELYLYATVSGPAPSSPPVPDFRLFLSSGVGLTDPSPIGVSLNVSDTSLLDPLLGLRINWRAVRLDTGEEVLNQDTPLTAASATIDIDRWSGDLKFNNTWSVTSEVYRPADALIPRYTYDTETIQVGVDDVVDRHHPFVQWNYEAWFHVRAGHGPLKQHPFWNRNRTSRIHRTDILIRCLMVNRAIPEHDVPPPLEYLDTLEAFGSFDDVESWRHGVLCDYCFFGGPTRTVWKIPTPPTPEWE